MAERVLRAGVEAGRAEGKASLPGLLTDCGAGGPHCEHTEIR